VSTETGVLEAHKGQMEDEKDVGSLLMIVLIEGRDIEGKANIAVLS